MKLHTDITAINKALDSISNRGKKLDGDIHKVACSIMAHFAENRDGKVVERLMEVMPKSSRRKALIDWFEAYVPVTISYTNGTVDMPKAKAKEWQDFIAEFGTTLKTAIATPFWDYKPEKGAKDAISFEAVVAYIERKAKSEKFADGAEAKIVELAAYARKLNGGEKEVVAA
jgi:hypothetical protein